MSSQRKTRLLALGAYIATSLAIPLPTSISNTPARVSSLTSTWPTYDQLPLNSSYPTKVAWGVWGLEDTAGALNHITEETTLAALNEIRSGRTFNLDLQLKAPTIPINPDRKPLQHLFQPAAGYTDDVVVMNTQVSTQYDGLRHYPYSTNNTIETYQWYNDLIETYDDVIGPTPSAVLGIQQAANKAIATRGVLLDFAAWAVTQSISYDALTTNYSITAAQLDRVAKWQGLTGQWSNAGDILFVRTGWLEQYNALSSYDQNTLPYAKDSASVGLLASDDTLRWLWDKNVSVVAADNPAFESTPFAQDIGGVPRSLHQVLIGGKQCQHAWSGRNKLT